MIHSENKLLFTSSTPMIEAMIIINLIKLTKCLHKCNKKSKSHSQLRPKMYRTILTTLYKMLYRLTNQTASLTMVLFTEL